MVHGIGHDSVTRVDFYKNRRTGGSPAQSGVQTEAKAEGNSSRFPLHRRSRTRAVGLDEHLVELRITAEARGIGGFENGFVTRLAAEFEESTEAHGVPVTAQRNPHLFGEDPAEVGLAHAAMACEVGEAFV